MLGGVFRSQQLGDDNRLAPDSVAKSVRALGKDARAFKGADKIADYLAAEAKPGDLLLMMSNGSFDGLCDKLLKKLGDEVHVPCGGHPAVICIRFSSVMRLLAAALLPQNRASRNCAANTRSRFGTISRWRIPNGTCSTCA